MRGPIPIAMLLAALAAVLPARAHAAPFELAVQDDAALMDHRQAELLERARELGATRIRFNVYRGAVLRDGYRWVDRALFAAAAAGFRLEVTVSVANEYVTPAQFAAFAGETAKRYAGIVDAWQVQNEPNCCGWLLPPPAQCVTHLGTAVTISPQGERETHKRIPVRVWRRVAYRRRVRGLVHVRERGRWVLRHRWIKVRRAGRTRWLTRRAYRRVPGTVYVHRAVAEALPPGQTLTSVARTSCTQEDLGRHYRRVYLAAYQALKAADPTAEVLVGGLSPGHRDFIDAMLAGPTPADGIAVHPYQQGPARERAGHLISIGRLDELRDVLDDAAERGAIAPDIPLWLDEFGYFNRAGRDTAHWQNVPATERAARWTEVLDLVCATPNVRMISAYGILTRTENWDTTLLDPDGRPDAAFRAIRDWVAARPECRA